MPKTRRPYPMEFRQRMIDLVRAGRSPDALAREFEPSAQAIRNWIRQGDRDEGRRDDGLTTDDRTELQRLWRENATRREERDILKEAAAWFWFLDGAMSRGIPLAACCIRLSSIISNRSAHRRRRCAMVKACPDSSNRSSATF